MKTFSIWLAIIFMPLMVTQTNADNWGHWRGPSGNGVAENAAPPTQWSPTKNIKWKFEIPGKGSGSPIVWDDKVFVVTGISKGAASGERSQPSTGQRGGRRRGRGRGMAPTETTFKLLCIDRSTGKLIWESEACKATPHQGTHSTNNFASASPCTDGTHVYAFFGSRGLYCYSMTGDLVWKKDDFGKMDTRNSFGEGASPTLAGDKIIVPWDHEGDSSIFALDKMTGETIWRTRRDEPTNWSTPLIAKNGDGFQVVMNGQTCARGYDLETGEELWRCGGQTDRPCASAVSDFGLVFVGSGFRGSYLGAFDLDGRGNLANSSNVVWSTNRDTPDIASPLLSENRLYYHKGKTGILTCVDAKTGDPLFSATRIPGVESTYASPVAAGGFVFLTGRSGSTTIIKDSGQFELVSRNSVGEGVDATPAIAGNEVFIRGEKHLFCIAN
ncbi:MAG: PQQ-binding-like beta-propeller repeat protein [Planctomycetota bacterium]